MLFVDTSTWSLALRRDQVPTHVPQVARLRQALQAGEELFTTGLVLQELMQGIKGPKERPAMLARFSALPMLVPDRRDHAEAALLHSTCRQAGMQAGTIDVLLAQLCIRHRLVMLTTDDDFVRIASVAPLEVWPAPASPP